MNSEFFEIGAKTNFSFLEGASKPEEMVIQAARLKLGGLGIADRNSVAGVVRAHAQAEQIAAKYANRHEIAAQSAKEIKEEILDPIRVQPGARLVFSDGTPDILAYPRNRQGWANLCRLLSAGNLKEKAVKGTCILTEADLMEWGDEMMLALIPERVVIKDPERQLQLENYLERFQKRFRKAFFMALYPAYDGRDRQAFAVFSMLSFKSRVSLIATNQPLYHHPDRRPLSDVVVAIREHVQLAKAGFLLAPNAERYLKSWPEIVRTFRDYPDALENTRRFFEKLTFSLTELEHNYPLENDPGETPQETLERLTRAGAAKRYPDRIPDEIAKKIDYELKLVREKNYASFFLTVHKIIQHARHELKILCQGRGSAANSVICYCLEITEVNPEKNKLLFDRFISMDRHEPPDIDVDFEHDRREEVIQHIYAKYGKEHAGLTAGVTSYRTRSAGREVAKAFGLSEDVQSAISSLIWGWSEDKLSDRDAKAAGLDVENPVTKNVLKYASELLGFPRHLTQHVGGFVITRDRLDEVVPVMKTAMPGRYMIEWDKDDLDNVKILKVDVLALGMLTCLRKAFSLLELHYEVKKELADLGHREHGEEGVPVYDMICRADTLGVFQIESRAQMSMLPRLRPREFYDLVIEVAIVRPGPIQGDMVHPYLKRREQKAKNIPIEYPSPALEEVLKRTLGVPLFQEQAMQIAITGADFEPAEADRLRRSMATFKRTGTIESFKKRFIEGMVKNRYSKEFAEQCFNQIKGFGEYGFPESHAASFALLVYASSWMKAYYPDVFCAAMLNSQPMGFYAPAQLVRDAREHGVKILPVDINESHWDCTLEDAAFDRNAVDFRHREMRDVIKTRYAVRLGFRQVKGLSAKSMERFLENRGEGYVSLYDLWLRSGLDKSDIERLADADAFQSIKLSRREALWEARALGAGRAVERLPLFDQKGSVDLQVEPKTELPEMLPGEQVIEDYRYLSLSLKAHPVSFLRNEFREVGITRNVDLLTIPNGKRVIIAGLVLVRQRPGSAKGVIFMTIEDETGVANAIVWKKTFDRYRAIVMGARLVKIYGKLQSQSGVIHTVVEHIEDMTPALGILQQEARRFGASDRSDEAMRPTVDHRQKKIMNAMERAVLEKRMSEKARAAGVVETVKVMPRGRNFH